MQARVKICGILRVDDALEAARCGADAIGLVFYPPSSRALQSLDLARDIALSVGPFVNVVALFVDPDEVDVAAVLSKVPVDCLQFHGNEPVAFCERFERPYIKALRMKPEIDIAYEMNLFPSARGFLLDSYVKGQPGGTGECFQWDRIPSDLRSSIVLAGGLNPDNIENAVTTVKPYAVDVSGGVESEAGLKSHAKIAAFIKKAKSEF